MSLSFTPRKKPIWLQLAGAAFPVFFDCQQRGGCGGDEILAESRSGSIMGSFRGEPPPKPPGYFLNHSLRLPLEWDVSLVGIVSVQRGRGRRVFKRKSFKRSFELGGIFIFLKQSTKIYFVVIHSMKVGQEVSKTEGEPIREWTGGTPTHWLLLQLAIELEVTEAEKRNEEKEDRRQDPTTD
jgi:hypothetical protein